VKNQFTERYARIIIKMIASVSGLIRAAFHSTREAVFFLVTSMGAVSGMFYFLKRVNGERMKFFTHEKSMD